jgi:hypothetical protein
MNSIPNRRGGYGIGGPVRYPQPPGMNFPSDPYNPQNIEMMGMQPVQVVTTTEIINN